ncbi:hypothetical protein D3C81_645320 [compost metagenome]
MPLQPLIQPFQHLRAADAVLQVKIQRFIAPVGWPEHVHLALTATFQRNRVQLAVGGGFNVQRDQFQGRAVFRCRFHLPVDQRAIAVDLAAEPDRCGDKTLHQVAFRRANIGLIEVNAAVFQQPFQFDQLAMLTAIQPQHRAMMEIGQRQRF